MRYFSKYFETSQLLILPFIIVPFLITHRLQDPTLLIKRSGAFIIVFFISVILLIVRKKINNISWSRFNWIISLLIFVILMTIISSYNALNISEAYWEILYLIGWVAVYLTFMAYSSKDTIHLIVFSTSIIGSILSLMLFNDLFQLVSFNIPSSGIMSATFSNRNFFGQYLCFAIPASITAIFISRSYKQRQLMIACLLITTGGLLLTRTKAAWIGILIAVIIFTFYNRKKMYEYIKLRKKITVSIISIGFIIIFNIINTPAPGTTETFKWHKYLLGDFNLKDHDANYIGKSLPGFWNIFMRIGYYKSTLNMMKDYPLFGVGLGNWRLVYPHYYISPFSEIFIKDGPLKSANIFYTDKNNFNITQRPHDDFLWLLSEAGAIGMIFILYFIFGHLKYLIQLLKRCNNNTRDYYLLLFLMMSIIAIIVESFFDFPRQRAVPNLYMWSILGCTASWGSQVSNKISFNKSIPLFSTILLFVVCIFCYFDIKSHLYSQESRYYNDQNMPNELYASSIMALNNYRTVDYAGTPLYYYAGIAKYKMGHTESAKLLFQKAREVAPYHLGVLTNYMIVTAELGQLETAASIMKTIQRIYPLMAKPRLDMAKFYLKAEKNEEAEEILLKLIESNLDDEKGTARSLLEYLDNLNK